MTKDLITGGTTTQLLKAFQVMVKHKVGKLPIVNKNGLIHVYHATLIW